MTKNESKKDIIAKSAVSCFAKYGITNTSIQDIANEANVNKSLIFYYYKNKENLFIDLVKKQQTINLEEVKKIIKECNNPLEQFENIIDKIFSHIKDKKHLDLIKIVHEQFMKNSLNKIKNEIELYVNEIIDLISQVIDRCIEQGYFRKINSRLMTINIFSFMFFLTKELIYSNRMIKEEEVKQFFQNLYFEGLKK